MKPLHSYVPETDFLKDKHQFPSRTFFEDCAVLDVEKGYRVLACRGEGLAVGADFPRLCGIPKEELAFLERALVRTRRVLLNSRRGPILIFAEALAQTGALIAVLPHGKPSSLLRALTLAGQNVISLSPAFANAPASANQDDAEACEHIEEIFFYMDRILCPEAALGIWTRSLLIANFTGCKLDLVSLPVDALAITQADEMRLSLFLFCTFLAMRHESGKVFAISRHPTQKDLPYRYVAGVTQCTPLDPKTRGARDLSQFPFLSLPAFRDFSVSVSQNKIVLEALLPQKSREAHLLHSACDALLYLQIELVA